MTEPTDKHKAEADALIAEWGEVNTASIYMGADDLSYRIASALASRDTEVREVLEGLSIVMNYANGAVRCWCFSCDGLHSPPCLATRALWLKLQPVKESIDEQA